MQVILRRNWFSPQGLIRKSARKSGPPVEIADALRPFLPSDAVVIEKFLTPRMVHLGYTSSDKTPDGLFTSEGLSVDSIGGAELFFLPNMNDPGQERRYTRWRVPDRQRFVCWELPEVP